jgi:CRISPR-associated exonuclease Cas4
MASEIARYLFCSRALAYDNAHPEERIPSRWRQGRQVIISLWTLLILLAGLGHLVVVGDWLLTLLSFIGGLLIFGLLRLIWWRIRQPNNITYQGAKAFRNRRTLVSREIGLAGKPDYLLEMNGSLVPVLTRNNPAPDTPHESHIMQVVAYCLLIAEETRRRPRFGVICYGDGRTFEVDFDEESVERLSRIMEDIDASHRRVDVPINHHDRQRCFACRHRQRCDQSLFS